MVAAAYLSTVYGQLPAEEFARIERDLTKFGFQTRVSGFLPEEVLAASKSDKKMVGANVKFILLDKIGTSYIYRDFTDEQLLSGIRYVCGLEDAHE